MTTKNDDGQQPGKQPETTTDTSLALGHEPMQHLDDEELARLEAEVAEMEAASDAKGKAGPETDAEPAPEMLPGQREVQKPEAPNARQQPAAPQGAPQQPEDQAAIPKPRFDQVLGERDKAMQEAAYWRGVAEARNAATSAKPADDSADGKPQPTAEQQAQALEKQLEAVWQRYDDGELNLSDMRRQERDLERQITTLRTRTTEHRDVEPSSQRANEDLYLLEKTREIEARYPVIGKLSRDHLETLATLAYQQAAMEGKSITPDAAGTLDLRERVGNLAQQFYGGGGGHQQPAGYQPVPSPAVTTQPQPAAGPGLDKIATARLHPPAPATLGTSSVRGDGEMTAEQAAGLSVDELAALPDSVLRRMSTGG